MNSLNQTDERQESSEASADMRGHARTSPDMRAPARASAGSIEEVRVPGNKDALAQTSPDMPGHARAESSSELREIEPEDRFTLTTKQVAEILEEKGVSRPESTIRRYFRQGKIKADEIDGQFGKEWLANEIDVHRFAEHLRQLELGRKASRGTLDADAAPPAAQFDAPPASVSREADAETSEAVDIAEDDGAASEPEAEIAREFDPRLEIENASLKAENVQLKERLTEKREEVGFLRDQVQEANDAAKRASQDAEQFKVLLARQNEQFAPLIESVSRRADRDEPVEVTPTKPLFENAEIEATQDEAA